MPVKKKPIEAKATGNAITTLKSGLALAFDSPSDNPSSKYERARYAHALKAISTFLKEVGIASYQMRFYRLALALDDLNHGSVDPLLEPVKTGSAKNRNVSWHCSGQGFLGKRRPTGRAQISRDKRIGGTHDSEFHDDEDSQLVRRFQQRRSKQDQEPTGVGNVCVREAGNRQTAQRC
jgi:hypothetical protein